MTREEFLKRRCTVTKCPPGIARSAVDNSKGLNRGPSQKKNVRLINATQRAVGHQLDDETGEPGVKVNHSAAPNFKPPSRTYVKRSQ